MPQQLINRSTDLKRLQDEGYAIEVQGNHLLLRNVPYVTPSRKVEYGILVSELTLTGDVTTTPSTHVVMFAGEIPCNTEGRPLNSIIHSSKRTELGEGLIVDHLFSSKPAEGYPDYYDKMTTYADMISGPAQSINANATARAFPVLETQDQDSVFHYIDTASSRANIGAVTERLVCGPVAIVGQGGTGSYILDLVAKTPVKEIHLFDSDQFLQHNAFRSPGAPSIETLKMAPQKTTYFREIYSKMRRNICAHGYLDESTVDELRGMDFVFLALDNGHGRRLAIDKLEEFGLPFIDVGMGVEEVDGSLVGQLRVTTSTPEARSHVRPTVPLSDGNGGNAYSRNIQIADLNMLNAALAVVKWKKLMGFYRDLENEHSSIYQIDGNFVINENRM